MNEELLKFFGVTARGAEKIVRVEPSWHLPFPPLVLTLLVAVILGSVFFLYRREQGEFGRVRRIAMAVCRMAFMLLLLLILLRPVLAVTVGTSVRETMAVVIDTSSSMKIADVREQPEDIRRADIALGRVDPKTGRPEAGALPPPTEPLERAEIVKGILNHKTLDLLPRIGKEFDVALFSFDRVAAEIPDAKTLKAEGEVTALGDALRQVVVAKRGRALGGIFVVTDGASNSGSSLLSAAQLAKAENVPLYIYGVGITSPKDILVSNIMGAEVAFVNDQVPVAVRVRSKGLVGQRGMLVLKLDGTRVDEMEVSFDREGEQIIPMKFTPTRIGDFTLEASISPRGEEIVKDNNASAPKHLRVVDGRIKVLHVEQTPRWEFKYLQAMLMRDRRVDYHCWLVEADPGVTSEYASGRSPYLPGFPLQKEDLLKYDLIILGDVDPRRLPAGAMEDMNSFVSTFGGGLIMIAGPRAAPQNYRRTPIEQMLPVELESTAAASIAAQNVTDVPIRLELTPAGKAHQALKLADSDAESLRLWESLPPVYWTARVSRPKPAAEVLMVDNDPGKASRFGKMPVMALQQYGLGQVLYVGTDNTWRWRRNQGDEIFNRVWSQLVERMALAHMLGLAKRTQLSMDKEKYSTGDRVAVYARLYRDKTFEPITEPTLKGKYAAKGDADATPHEVLLRALPDQPGMYRAEFVAPAAGTYQLKVETDTQTSVDFLVTQSNIELAETSLNEAALRTLAEQSPGGKFVREEDLHALPDQMRHIAQPILSTYEVDIWSSPIFFGLVLFFVTIEWFLRKRAQLK